MTKRTEDWIYIIEPDGTQKIAGPGYIRKLLSIENITSEMFVSLINQVQKIEDVVETLEKPFRQRDIIELLKEDGNFRTEMWISRRLPRFSYLDLHELLEKGVLATKRSGPHFMYGVEKR